MEDCMIEQPEPWKYPWDYDDEDDPLDAFSADEISLFMTDPEGHPK